MNKADISAADAAARLQFTYKEDAPGIANNLWRSFADNVLAGKPWQGDCSDLTSTVLDLLCRKDEVLENQYRLVVISGVDGDTPDHLIGCAVADDGSMWIVADTFFNTIYDPVSIPHGAYIYNRLSEAGANPIWRTGFPWTRT